MSNAFHLTNYNRKFGNSFITNRIHSNAGRLFRNSRSDNNDDSIIPDDAVNIENDSSISRKTKEETSPDPVTPLNQLSDGTGLQSTEPLFGEVEIDGSIVVLAPAIVIGFFGILTTFLVASQARDEFIDEMDLSNSPPPIAVTVDENKCRGICNDQDESFESLKTLMNSSKKSSPEKPVLSN